MEVKSPKTIPPDQLTLDLSENESSKEMYIVKTGQVQYKRRRARPLYRFHKKYTSGVAILNFKTFEIHSLNEEPFVIHISDIAAVNSYYFMEKKEKSTGNSKRKKKRQSKFLIHLYDRTETGVPAADVSQKRRSFGSRSKLERRASSGSSPFEKDYVTYTVLTSSPEEVAEWVSAIANVIEAYSQEKNAIKNPILKSPENLRNLITRSRDSISSGSTGIAPKKSMEKLYGALLTDQSYSDSETNSSAVRYKRKSIGFLSESDQTEDDSDFSFNSLPIDGTETEYEVEMSFLTNHSFRDFFIEFVKFQETNEMKFHHLVEFLGTINNDADTLDLIHRFACERNALNTANIAKTPMHKRDGSTETPTSAAKRRNSRREAQNEFLEFVKKVDMDSVILKLISLGVLEANAYALSLLWELKTIKKRRMHMCTNALDCPPCIELDTQFTDFVEKHIIPMNNVLLTMYQETGEVEKKSLTKITYPNINIHHTLIGLLVQGKWSSNASRCSMNRVIAHPELFRLVFKAIPSAQHSPMWVHEALFDLNSLLLQCVENANALSSFQGWQEWVMHVIIDATRYANNRTAVMAHNVLIVTNFHIWRSAEKQRFEQVLNETVSVITHVQYVYCVNQGKEEKERVVEAYNTTRVFFMALATRIRGIANFLFSGNDPTRLVNLLVFSKYVTEFLFSPFKYLKTEEKKPEFCVVENNDKSLKMQINLVEILNAIFKALQNDIEIHTSGGKKSGEESRIRSLFLQIDKEGQFYSDMKDFLIQLELLEDLHSKKVSEIIQKFVSTRGIDKEKAKISRKKSIIEMEQLTDK